MNNESETPPVVKQKRGRKSKKELQAIQEQKEKEKLEQADNNINITLQEKDSENINMDNVTEEVNEYDLGLDETSQTENTIIKPPPKKRGRKPKGGKIVQQTVVSENVKEVRPNVIMHLKCSLKDLYDSNNNNNTFGLEAYNDAESDNFQIINFNNSNQDHNSNVSQNKFSLFEKTSTNINDLYDKQNDNDNDDVYYESHVLNEIHQTKEIYRKLKVLEHSLHTNNLSDKKSACFWCTYDFDNPPVYIPKHFIKDTYHVYGCFCSPECATAYLMEENLDSSTRFERYHLINHIYSKIYNYTKNIKPAPNPYYMLNKYYGNLSIQEYRALLKNERLFLIVDKPLTRVLPELHEDNDDFIINNKIIPSNNLQIKKKLQRKVQTKTNIMNEKFGLSTCE